MSIDASDKQLKEFLEKAQLVFMVNFEDNSQHVAIGQNVPVGELLISPFRLSVHLNDLIEKNINEGQTGETVEEASEAEAE